MNTLYILKIILICVTYRVSTNFRPALIGLYNAVCYKGLIFLEFNERLERGGYEGERRRREHGEAIYPVFKL